MPKYLSRADLERISGTVINQYYQTVPRAGTLPAPVDPVALSKEVMGLETRYLPLSDDGSILGVACFQETALEVVGEDGSTYQVQLTGRDIVIDSSLLDDDKIGRRNFTAAHELAHHILVRLYPEDYRDLINCRKHVLYRDEKRDNDWVEWQANVLGACILMPAHTIRYCMYMFGLAERTDMVSSACKAKEYEKFCDMSMLMFCNTASAPDAVHVQLSHERRKVRGRGEEEGKLRRTKKTRSFWLRVFVYSAERR